MGGITQATDPGNYTATFTPDQNHCWEDGTTETKVIAWSISGGQVSAIKYIAYEYTGEQIAPVWADYFGQDVTISGAKTGTEVGAYEITVTPKMGYQWPDGSTEARTIQWLIVEHIISKVPEQVGDAYWIEGYPSNVNWEEYDTSALASGYTLGEGNVPIYYWRLQNTDEEIRYIWWDMTLGDKVSGPLRTTPYIIAKVPEQIKTLYVGDYTYYSFNEVFDESNYGLNISVPANVSIGLGVSVTSTPAGTYEITFTPKSGCEWFDHTTGPKTCAFTVSFFAIEAVPTLLQYDSSGRPVFDNYNLSFYPLSTEYMYQGQYTKSALMPYLQGTAVSAYDNTESKVSALPAEDCIFEWRIPDPERVKWWDGTAEPKYGLAYIVTVLSELPKFAGYRKLPFFTNWNVNVLAAYLNGVKMDDNFELYEAFVQGENVIEWHIIQPEKYKWWDDTTEPKTSTLTINPVTIISVPQQIETFNGSKSGYMSFDIWYEQGSVQSSTVYTDSSLKGFVNGMDISPIRSADLDPGTYTIEWRLQPGCEWWDGTTAPKYSTLTVS